MYSRAETAANDGKVGETGDATPLQRDATRLQDDDDALAAATRHVSVADLTPQDLMEATAQPLREECLKGLLNGEAVFALVRGQVSPGDERIEPRLGQFGTNLLLASQTVLRVRLSWGREHPRRAGSLTRGLSRFANYHCRISQHIDAKTSLSRPDCTGDNDAAAVGRASFGQSHLKQRRD